MADWVALGDRAIRFPKPAGASAGALVRTIRAWPGVVDVVVAREDVGVYFDAEPLVDPERLELLATLRDDTEPPREVEIPVIYDGPDLDDVARATGLSRDDVVRIHAATTYVVETMGFAPGFGYLARLDPRLDLPRRATPRAKVTANTVAIAAGYTAVYPFDSPGGWHLIGRAIGVRMFGEEGALLRLGDHVRFTR